MFSKNKYLNIDGCIKASSNRNSTSGYFTFVGGNLLSHCKVQKAVALSIANIC